MGRGCSSRPRQLSDADHLQPQSPVSKTKGRSRNEAILQKRIQNNQQKNLMSYIYPRSICISLIPDKVKHVCVYLLAIWIFSPVITGLRIVPNFLLNVSIPTDLEPFILNTSPCLVTCVRNTLFHSVVYFYSLLMKSFDELAPQILM